jgi:TatD DNase family protein
MDMGFHIGVNGCSLKTEQNLLAAKAIRPGKIMLETGRVLSMSANQRSNYSQMRRGVL